MFCRSDGELNVFGFAISYFGVSLASSRLDIIQVSAATRFEKFAADEVADFLLH